MLGRFKCLYWLFKEELAHTTKFTSLVHLAKLIGVEYLGSVEKGANVLYTSREFVLETLQVTASVIRKPIFDTIRQSPFYSLLIDETTDMSVSKELIIDIYAKYLNTTLEPPTPFIGIIQLQNGQADTIYQALLKSFRDKKNLDVQVTIVAANTFFLSTFVARYYISI